MKPLKPVESSLTSAYVELKREPVAGQALNGGNGNTQNGGVRSGVQAHVHAP